MFETAIDELIPLSHFASLTIRNRLRVGLRFLVGRRSRLCLMIWAATVFAAETLAGCWMKSAQVSFGQRSIAKWRKLRRLRLTSCGWRRFGRACRLMRFLSA